MPATSAGMLVARQGIQNTVDGVKHTFTSWDSCMAKAYCKWPAIIGIVLGSLFLLSILFCCVRCLCCGMECCCGICACCNACCPSPREKKNRVKYQDAPYRPVIGGPQPFQPQYQSHPPPSYSSPAFNRSAPQYAQFDVGKPSNPDALPAMPSWEGTENKKVEVYEDPPDSVEMHDLDENGHKPGTAGSQGPMLGEYAAGAAGGAAAAGGLRPGMASRGPSHSPYGASSPQPSAVGSPYDERQSFMGAMDHGSPPPNHYSTAGEATAYGGAATNGYRGYGPATSYQDTSSYGAQHNSAYGAVSPPISQSRPFLAHAQSSSYQQPARQPEQRTYQAFSPPAAAGGTTTSNQAAYPGQRTYTTGEGPRSPVSPLSPHPTDYSGTTLQNARGPQPYGQGWQRASVERRPVNGSWREI